MGLSPLHLHRAPGCRPCNLRKPLVPGPHSVEMDLGMQWGVDACEPGEEGGHLPGPLGDMEEIFFLGCLLSPPPAAPHPTSAHMDTPHQEQGLFVGLIRPAPLESFSINKPSFMGW